MKREVVLSGLWNQGPTGLPETEIKILKYFLNSEQEHWSSRVVILVM